MVLTDFESALNSVSEVGLTTIGGVSGRETFMSLWFVRRGGNLYLLPRKTV